MRRVQGLEIKFTPKHLMQLLDLIDKGVITRTTAKEVFEQMFYTGQAPDEIVAARGLQQIADSALPPLDKRKKID